MSSFINIQLQAISRFAQLNPTDIKQQRGEISQQVQRLLINTNKYDPQQVQTLLDNVRTIHKNAELFKKETQDLIEVCIKTETLLSEGITPPSSTNIETSVEEKNDNLEFNKKVITQLLEDGLSRESIESSLAKLGIVDAAQSGNLRMTQTHYNQIKNADTLTKLENQLTKDLLYVSLSDTQLQMIENGDVLVDEKAYNQIVELSETKKPELEEQKRKQDNLAYTKVKLQDLMEQSPTALQKALEKFPKTASGEQKVTEKNLEKIQTAFYKAAQEENTQHNAKYIDQLQNLLSNKEIFSTTHKSMPIAKTLQEIQSLENEQLTTQQQNYLQNAKTVLQALSNPEIYQENQGIMKRVLEIIPGGLGEHLVLNNDINPKDTLIRLLRNTKKLSTNAPSDIKKEIAQIRFKKYQDAFSTLIVKTHTSQEMNLTENLAQTAYHLEFVREEYSKAFDQFDTWVDNKFTKLFDKETLQWLKENFSVAQFKADKELILSWFLEDHIKKNAIPNALFQNREQDFALLQSSLDEALKPILQESNENKLHSQFLRDRTIKSGLTEMKFLAKNRRQFVVPYDQGFSKTDHLEKGTCFGESAIGHEALLETDYHTYFSMLKEEEKVHEFSRGKMMQLKYLQGIGTFTSRDKAISGKITAEQRSNTNSQSAIEYSGNMQYITTDRFQKAKEQTFGELLVDQLQENAPKIQEHQGAILVNIYGEESAHALNIKIDHQNGVYIIHDVNYGKSIMFIPSSQRETMEPIFKEQFPDKEFPEGDYNDFTQFLKKLCDTSYSTMNILEFSYAKKK